MGKHHIDELDLLHGEVHHAIHHGGSHSMKTTDYLLYTLQGEGQSPVSFALMLSWEMMHCRVIRAVDHTQTLYLLVRTRSKDLYTADKLQVGPLVFVIATMMTTL